MQRVLRSCGEFIGHRPILVYAVSTLAYLGLCTGWYKATQGPIVAKTDSDEMWSIRGGDVEREVLTVKELQNKDWQVTAHVTMILGKGAQLDADMLTPEIMQTVEPLYSRFFSLKVTTASGLEYDTWDLCARGPMPDYPGDAAACEAWEDSNRTDAALQAACFPSVMFPCMTIAPQHCFSEHVAQLPPSYQGLDPLIGAVTDASFLGRPYVTRPSYRNLSAAEMRAEVSKQRVVGLPGCEWFSGLWVFPPNNWGGDVQWNSNRTLVTKVPVMRWVLFYDAVPRISFKLSVAKPGHAVETEIEEALRLHEEAWQKEILAFQERTTDLEVLNVGPSLEDDLEEGVNTVRWGLIILGGVLMTLFICVSLGSFQKPFESRLNLAQLGLGQVILSLAGSAGILLHLGFEFNAAMLASLPFMAMGLGLDDIFVLIRYYSDLGVDFIVEKSHPEIIGEVLARGGAGATLTSVCNMAAFGTGALLPVQAMSDFCIGAFTISLLNYLAVLTQFLPLMVLESVRLKRRQPEPQLLTFFCQRRVLQRQRQQQQQSGGERQQAALEQSPAAGAWFGQLTERSTAFLKNWYGPMLARPLIKVLVCALACGTAALSCWSVVENMSIGFDISEIAVRGTQEQRALELWEKFEVVAAQICFVDLDLPKYQREVLELYDAVINSPHAQIFDTAPFLTLFTFHVAGMAATAVPGVANTTYADQGWVLDDSWTHPILAPLGTVTSNSSAFYAAYDSWSRMPLDNPMDAYLPGGNAFLTADMTFTNEFRVENGELRFSFAMFYQSGLKTQKDILQAIREVRQIFADSPLPKEKAFPYGPTFTYWSVFLELEGILYRVLLIDAVAIFGVTLLLLRSLTAAVASMFACVLIVVQVYGSSLLFARFNFFVAAGLLAAAGISVEFTSHLVSAFDAETGPVGRRLGTALAHTTPPLVQGALSTLLSILPMAFSPLIFVVKYFFALFALVCLFGLLAGMLFLPACLASVASPISWLTGTCRGSGMGSGSAEAQEEEEAAPSPTPPDRQDLAPAILGAGPTAAQREAKSSIFV